MPKTSTSFKKGDPRAGRKKGIENKTTQETKDFIVSLLKGQHENILIALDEVFNENKNSYLIHIAKLLPFVLPKNVDITTNGQNVEKTNIPMINFING